MVFCTRKCEWVICRALFHFTIITICYTQMYSIAQSNNETLHNQRANHYTINITDGRSLYGKNRISRGLSHAIFKKRQGDGLYQLIHLGILDLHIFYDLSEISNFRCAKILKFCAPEPVG